MAALKAILATAENEATADHDRWEQIKVQSQLLQFCRRAVAVDPTLPDYPRAPGGGTAGMGVMRTWLRSHFTAVD